MGAKPETRSDAVPYPRRHCPGTDEEEHHGVEPLVEELGAA